ncbi:MAG: hypothetical protein ACM3OO_01775 [Planctomycetaceae bacterium]
MSEHQQGPSRSPKPVVLALVSLVLVAVVAVAVVHVLGSGASASSPIASSPESSPLPIPALHLRVTHAVGVPTSTTTTKAQLEKAARAVKPKVVAVLTQYLVAAFLDPANWQTGDYQGAFATFTPHAAAEATKRTEVLTAGAGAGDVFTTIEPKKGDVGVQVLVDRGGNPYSAIGVVTFAAEGTRKDGSGVTMLTKGQFTLQHLDGAWKVVAFEVGRRNTKTPAPAPSASASPSAGGAGA